MLAVGPGNLLVQYGMELGRMSYCTNLDTQFVRAKATDRQWKSRVDTLTIFKLISVGKREVSCQCSWSSHLSQTCTAPSAEHVARRVPLSLYAAVWTVTRPWILLCCIEAMAAMHRDGYNGTRMKRMLSFATQVGTRYKRNKPDLAGRPPSWL